MAMQRDFGLKMGVWGKVAVQKNSWVKNGALGEMGVQRDFGLKWGFRGNECAKRLLGQK